MTGLVNIKRLFCSACSKMRWHEVLLGMAKCQAKECGYVREDALSVPPILPTATPLEDLIERFI